MDEDHQSARLALGPEEVPLTVPPRTPGVRSERCEARERGGRGLTAQRGK